MKPTFWKLSQGEKHFNNAELLDSVNQCLVYVHMDTKAKAKQQQSQAQDFIEASIGDYFYLTYGNTGIYLLGQFSGAVNIFSGKGDGWLDRPFRHIKSSISRDPYTGPQKWWAPNDNSTFMGVPPAELPMFEEHILTPYFGIRLSAFGVSDARQDVPADRP